MKFCNEGYILSTISEGISDMIFFENWKVRWEIHPNSVEFRKHNDITLSANVFGNKRSTSNYHS